MNLFHITRIGLINSLFVSNKVFNANIAALALAVSNIVSINNKSTFPSSKPRACSVYASTSASKAIQQKTKRIIKIFNNKHNILTNISKIRFFY